MSKPRYSHLNAAFRILKYLKGCPGLGLFYPSANPHRIQAFSDSDWATCCITRKSTTGYCVFYGNCLISWKSKKQSTVSRSSTEAEYRALASVACELQWLKYVADDLCLQIPLPFPTFCDNQSAIQLAKNPSFHERTKHIEVDCHLIRAKILDGLIVLSHVPSKHQLADMFTKSLYPGPFNVNLSKMGLLNIHHPS
nr:Copia protein [Cajanus cajan]